MPSAILGAPESAIGNRRIGVQVLHSVINQRTHGRAHRRRSGRQSGHQDGRLCRARTGRSACIP